MFDQKPDIAHAVDAVHALTTSLGRGQVLTHEMIQQTINLYPHEGAWDHIVNKVRRMLQDERGIATWPVIGVGYRLLTQSEQLLVPEWRMKRGLRQVRRGRKSLAALPETGLSVNQRRARVFMLDRLADTERSLRREIKGQQEQTRPTPTIPRRPALT